MRKSLLITCILVCGCGGYKAGAPPKTMKVSGKIVLASGQPLTMGRVIFWPKDPSKREAIGELDKNGSFVLASFEDGDGAQPGDYSVYLEPFSYRGGFKRLPLALAAQIPQRYRDQRTTPLTASVVDQSNAFTFKIR